ncbi:MAG: hypothetical protein E7667_00125 [Ruminococcaceae bacterium]|nr:hypothetical protein [Oscillospiraceae bacterium]
MAFTPAQQQALEISGNNVLVSAAAGSGKTYTLTQRIIKNILEKNADISRILVVTFTRAAAGELKSRISSALMDAIAQNPDNTHLQNQLLKLGGADICTIDSFLSRPVRENFEKLGLPVSMRIADEAEVTALSHNIMAEVMDSLYEKYGICRSGKLSDIDDNSPLTELFALLTTTVKDSSDTIPYLLRLHGKLITTPKGVDLLSDFSQRLSADSEKDFLETKEGLFVINELKKTIAGAVSFVEHHRDVMNEDDLLREKYLPTFEADISELLSIEKTVQNGYDALGEALSRFPSQKIGTLKAHQKSHTSEMLRAARDDIKKQIKNITDKYFGISPKDISDSYIKTAQITSVLYTLLSDFDKKLMSTKKDLGIYDFSDMPRYMMALLQNSDGTPTEAAKNISDSYDEIYIDEYQDVNEIQDKIFELIGKNNRFMVGDIKQSIYGFRDAEPTFFSNYRSTYTPYGKEYEKNPQGFTIFMSNNFRSDENVIKFSNTICSPMFKSCKNSIGYKDEDDLVFTKKCHEEYTCPKVSVNIFAKGDPWTAKQNLPHAFVTDTAKDYLKADDSQNGSGLCEEAVVAANTIAELIQNGKKSNGAPIAPSDIAILVRKKDAIPEITSALRALGIEYLVASKSELLQSREMVLLRELCTIIDNPRNDIPLCSVLSCELLPEHLRFSIGETVTVRKHADKSLSLYDAICQYGESGIGDPLDTLLSAKCREIVKKLCYLRSMSVKLSVDKFLKFLTADDVFGSFTEGDAFRFMYDYACKYTKSFWNGLSGFNSYFADIAEHSNVSGEVQPIQNAVNIITVHYSKGLQYNTCILYGFGGEFNVKEYQKSLLYDKEFCVGMHMPSRVEDNINILKNDCIIHRVLAADLSSKAKEEEMRILYVAMTRAEERLYIFGTVGGKSKFETFFDKFRLYGISDVSTASQPSLLGWIVGGLFTEHDKSTYTVTLHSVFNNTPLAQPIYSEDVSGSCPENSAHSNYSELILTPPSGSPDEMILSAIPSNIAASKASPSMLDESLAGFTRAFFSQETDSNTAFDTLDDELSKNLKNRIELMRSRPTDITYFEHITKKITAADKGVAMHLFLQYCDYKNMKENGVDSEISRLLDRGFISHSTADILDKRQLEGFLKSNIFGIILNAQNVRREFKFGISKPASEFTQNKQLSDIIKDTTVYVQGSIDLLIENSDGSIYLCDYKTDRIYPEEKQDPELLRKRLRCMHKSQLNEYSLAIEKIFGKKPQKTYILSLPLGEALEV